MAVYWSNNVACYLGTYDLGTATTRLSVALEQAALDRTAFGDAAERIQPNIRKDVVEWAGYFEDSSQGPDQAATDLVGTTPGTLTLMSILVGSSTGGRAYVGSGLVTFRKTPGELREMVRLEIGFQPDPTMAVGGYWNRKSSVAGGVVYGTHDNVVATTAGATGYAHVFSVPAGSLTLRVDHGTDGTTWVNSIMIIGDDNTATGVRTGTVGSGTSLSRYTRLRQANATATGTLAGVLLRS